MGSPNTEDRINIIKYRLNEHQKATGITDGQFQRLGILSEKFSASDVDRNVFDAINLYYQQAFQATHFKERDCENGKKEYEPYTPENDEVVDNDSGECHVLQMTYAKLESENLYVKKISFEHLEFVFKHSKPSCDLWEVNKFHQFESRHPTISILDFQKWKEYAKPNNKRKNTNERKWWQTEKKKKLTVSPTEEEGEEKEKEKEKEK